MLEQNKIPPPPESDVKFQIQATTKMIEKVNFVMGNVCDRLEKVEKHDSKLIEVPKT